MWVLRANHEDYGLGEGYTMEAFSEELSKLKAYTIKDAIEQGQKEEDIRIIQENGGTYIVQTLYMEGLDPSEDDNWGIWAVIELTEERISFPVNVDNLYPNI